MVALTIGLQYDRRTTNKVLEGCTKLLIMCYEHGEVQPNFLGEGIEIGKTESNKKHKLFN
jgi:hypothetical protein